MGRSGFESRCPMRAGFSPRGGPRARGYLRLRPGAANGEFYRVAALALGIPRGSAVAVFAEGRLVPALRDRFRSVYWSARTWACSR